MDNDYLACTNILVNLILNTNHQQITMLGKVCGGVMRNLYTSHSSWNHMYENEATFPTSSQFY